MLRNVLCGLAILLMSVGFVMSEELKGRLTKIENHKITLVNKKEAFEKTLEVAKDCKVCKMNKDGEKEPVADGLKGIDLGEKGVFVMVMTNDDGKATEITIMAKKKK